MVKVFVLQTDNRFIGLFIKNTKVNKKFCDILGYNYLFFYNY